MPLVTAAGGRTVGGCKKFQMASLKPLNRIIEKYIHNPNAGSVFC